MFCCIIEAFSSHILCRHDFISPEHRTAGIIRFISTKSSDIKTSTSWLGIEYRFPEFPSSHCGCYVTALCIWIFPQEVLLYLNVLSPGEPQTEVLRENCKIRLLLCRQ